MVGIAVKMLRIMFAVCKNKGYYIREDKKLLDTV